MTQQLANALLTAALLCLFGCGQMGPLYLPSGETVEEESAENAPSRKNDA